MVAGALQFCFDTGRPRLAARHAGGELGGHTGLGHCIARALRFRRRGASGVRPGGGHLERLLWFNFLCVWRSLFVSAIGAQLLFFFTLSSCLTTVSSFVAELSALSVPAPPAVVVSRSDPSCELASQSTSTSPMNAAPISSESPCRSESGSVAYELAKEALADHGPSALRVAYSYGAASVCGAQLLLLLVAALVMPLSPTVAFPALSLSLSGCQQ